MTAIPQPIQSSADSQERLEAELAKVKESSDRLYRIWRRHDALAPKRDGIQNSQKKEESLGVQ